MTPGEGFSLNLRPRRNTARYIQLSAAGLARAVSSEICPLFGRKIKDKKKEKKSISHIAGVSGHAGTGDNATPHSPSLLLTLWCFLPTGPSFLMQSHLCVFVFVFCFFPVPASQSNTCLSSVCLSDFLFIFYLFYFLSLSGQYSVSNQFSSFLWRQ